MLLTTQEPTEYFLFFSLREWEILFFGLAAAWGIFDVYRRLHEAKPKVKIKASRMPENFTYNGKRDGMRINLTYKYGGTMPLSFSNFIIYYKEENHIKRFFAQTLVRGEDGTPKRKDIVLDPNSATGRQYTFYDIYCYPDLHKKNLKTYGVELQCGDLIFYSSPIITRYAAIVWKWRNRKSNPIKKQYRV